MLLFHGMKKEYYVGQRLYGFEVVSVDSIPDYSADAVLLRHGTGFEVYALLNNDQECFFCYSIYTPPTDNSGVFHILEHTLLTGSERYKVRDPFMMMVRNSCNTFLNAMTGPDRTYYPAASPVKKDFENIFNVYTDAVFNPLLRKESFEQEGIRLTSKDGLHFEGVVFSEMKGDISQHDSVVASAAVRPLFGEDSPYRYEFGGNPPDICDLTYDRFIQTYKKYYVPANMVLFLYGDLDLDQKLEFLDSEYLQRDGGEKVERVGLSDVLSKPGYYRTTSCSDDGVGSSTASVSWLLAASEDLEFNTELSFLVDLLLDSPGSPLYKAVVESGFGDDLSSESGMSDSYRELVFSVGIDGIDESKAKDFEAYILSVLSKIVDEGFDERNIDSCLRRLEFRVKEAQYGKSIGYALFFSRIDKCLAYGSNPSKYLSLSKAVDDLKSKLENDSRYMEKWLKRNIIDNSHRLLSVVVKDSNTQRLLDESIEKKVEEHRKDYDATDDRAFHEFEAATDDIEELRSLPRLTSSDIPDIDSVYDREIIDDFVITKISTGGIVYVNIAFDVSDYSYEELEYLSLLSRLMQMTNVSDMDYASFLTELKFSTGDMNISVETGNTESGDDKVFVLVRFKALEEFYDDALRIVLKLLTSADVTNTERIKSTLIDIDSDFKSFVLRYGHQYMVGAAASSLSRSLHTIEKISGLNFWLTVKNMQNNIEGLGEMLLAVYRKTFVQKRMKLQIASDEALLPVLLDKTKVFAAALDPGCGVTEWRRKFVPSWQPKAYTLPTPVNYIGLAFPCGDMDSLLTACEKQALFIISRNSLWSLIREKGGAYGAGASMDMMEEYDYFYTYRDPRLNASIKDIRRAIESESFTDDKIEDALLATLAIDVRPQVPSFKAIVDFRRYLYGISDEGRRRRKSNLLSVTARDLERARDILLKKIDGKEVSIAVLTDQKTISVEECDFYRTPLPVV